MAARPKVIPLSAPQQAIPAVEIVTQAEFADSEESEADDTAWQDFLTYSREVRS